LPQRGEHSEQFQRWLRQKPNRQTNWTATLGARQIDLWRISKRSDSFAGASIAVEVGYFKSRGNGSKIRRGTRVSKEQNPYTKKTKFRFLTPVPVVNIRVKSPESCSKQLTSSKRSSSASVSAARCGR
jgi:hypothetical protein